MSTLPFEQSPSVTFPLSEDEFHLIAAFMGPLSFDESAGESIWVVSPQPNVRQWIVSTDDITAVIHTYDDPELVCDTEVADSWCLPIPENALRGLAKIFLTCDEIQITLSEHWVNLTSDTLTVTLAQNPRARRAPVIPQVHSCAEFQVNALNLWSMVSVATLAPAGGDGDNMRPPLRCQVDEEHEQLTISVDWSPAKLHSSQLRLPLEYLTRSDGFVGDLTFNIPVKPILTILRDSGASTNLGNITINYVAPDEQIMLLNGDNWDLYVPTIPLIEHWGHDLDVVLGKVPYEWQDASCINVSYPDIDIDVIQLSALPAGAHLGPYKYRASCEILCDVIPTLDLYKEINAINEGQTGFRIVIDGHRVMAIEDLTQEHYEGLETHVTAFAHNVAGLSPMLSTLSGTPL